MPPELELIKQWMERSAADLRSAQVLLEASPPLTETSCFHCQQTVEKALKALLAYRNVEFPWSHQIGYLFDLCADFDESIEQFRDSAVPLTDYAVRFRYPRGGNSPTDKQSRHAITTARQVYEFVLERLPNETHPC